MVTIFKRDILEFKEDSNKIEHYKLVTASPRLSKVACAKNMVFDLRILNPWQVIINIDFQEL